MEIQFENRYTADVKTMVEFTRKYRTNPRPAVAIPFAVVYTFLTLYLLHYGIWSALPKILIIIGLYCAFVALLPSWQVWCMRRAAAKDNEGVFPESVVVFGENIEVFEGMVHLTIGYHRVTEVVRLKHSYCLKMSSATAVMIREDAFTKGTFEEFKQFLREKYPHLPIPE